MPITAVIANQLDIAPGRHLFAALKEELFLGEQLSWENRTFIGRNALQALLDFADHVRNPTAAGFEKAQPQTFQLAHQAGKRDVSKLAHLGNDMGQRGNLIRFEKTIIVAKRSARVDRKGAAQFIGFMKNWIVLPMAKRQWQTLCRQNAADHPLFFTARLSSLTAAGTSCRGSKAMP